MNSKFSTENTIIVDDKLAKHLFGKLENIFLPHSQSYIDDGPDDGFLIDLLLPRLQQLHYSRGQGLLSFKRNDNIGRRMHTKEPDSLEYKEMMVAIDMNWFIIVRITSITI